MDHFGQNGSVGIGGKTTNDGSDSAGIYIGGYGAIQIARSGDAPYLMLSDVDNGSSVSWKKILGSSGCSNVSGYFNINSETYQTSHRLYVNGGAKIDGSLYANYMNSNGGNINSKGGNIYTEGGKLDASGGYLIVGSTTLRGIQMGEVTITPSAANTPTSKSVTFGTKFGGAPNVVAGVRSSVPGKTVTGWAATGMSASGFTAWVTRTNTTATDVQWIAVY